MPSDLRICCASWSVFQDGSNGWLTLKPLTKATTNNSPHKWIYEQCSLQKYSRTPTRLIMQRTVWRDAQSTIVSSNARQETITCSAPKGDATLPFTWQHTKRLLVMVKTTGKCIQQMQSPNNTLTCYECLVIVKSTYSLHFNCIDFLLPVSAPFVYLCVVSRTIELSLQSSLQLSLTVLVCYRFRVNI